MAQWIGAVAALGALLSASPLFAGCQIRKIIDIPVTMEGQSPIVTAQINGQNARFILDSGAFHSTIAKANALAFGLPVGTIAYAKLQGIGGETSLGVAVVKEFGIGGQIVPRVEFAVGGSDTGYAGLLGQNILGLADIEYDLLHGNVNMMKSEGCKGANLAYWAGTRPVTVVNLEAMSRSQRHTIGTVLVNGVKVKAGFDTGAGSTLTLATAKRLGLKPESEGVTSTGLAFGVGKKGVQSWRARLDSIDIGGELISKPWMNIVDAELGESEMLIGIDFFMTHHVYVDNANHKMFVTYEGGPFFGLNPRSAVQSTGDKIDLTDRTAEPTDAAGYSRRGAVHASHDKLTEAIADFDKAVAMAPDQAQYRYQRAIAYLRGGQHKQGTADLDKAIELAPKDAEIRMARARVRLQAADETGALADLQAADAAMPAAADGRLQLASLYEGAGSLEPALASYEQWFKAHPEDSSRPAAFNGRCWIRALMNRELDKAMNDCNAALKAYPASSAFLDSRALVWLRRGDLAKAQADYDAAIKARPKSAWSLYARSIVERRSGRIAEADADRAAALALDEDVAKRAKRYGLE